MENLNNYLDSSGDTRENHVTKEFANQIAKSRKIKQDFSATFSERNHIDKMESLPETAKVACQGIEGAYSHISANLLFKEPDIQFYATFEQVAKAVSLGTAEFGMLPIENSTAGAVSQVVELICQYNCYINTLVTIPINHCLCSVEGATIDSITQVHSHPQALRQADEFIKNKDIKPVTESNTAVSARLIKQLNDPTKACICSSLSCEIYGLKLLKAGVQNQKENYTRFVCISREPILLPKATGVAIALSFPNKTGELNQLLTLFSLFDLDLTRIQSMPIGGKDFNARFHLDFTGNILDKQVESLLGYMYNQYKDFQFLGNYTKLD